MGQICQPVQETHTVIPCWPLFRDYCLNRQVLSLPSSQKTICEPSTAPSSCRTVWVHSESTGRCARILDTLVAARGTSPEQLQTEEG